MARYDVPAQAQFINTYVPIPFQEIVQAGQNRQNVYDRNRLALEQKVGEAEMLNAIEGGDREEVDRTVKALREMSETYSTEDYSNPEVLRQLQRDFRSNVNPQLLQQIGQSHESWKENQALKRKYKAEGTYADYLDQEPEGWSTAESGTYNYVTPTALDYRKKAKTYFDDWYGSSFVDEERGMTYEGYRDERGARKIVSGALQSFLESPEGRQKMLELKSRGIADENLEVAAEDYLMEVSKEFYRQGNIGFVPGYSKTNRDRLQIPERGNTKRVVNPHITKNRIKIKDGEVQEYADYEEEGRTNWVEWFTGTNTIGQVSPIVRNVGVNEGVKQEQIQLLDDVRNYTYDSRGNGVLTNATQQEVLDVLIQARSNTSLVDLNKSMIETLSDQKQVASNVMQDIGSREIITSQSNKPKVLTSADQLYKELDSEQHPVKKAAGDEFRVNGVIPSNASYDMAIVDDMGISKATYEVNLPEPYAKLLNPLKKATEQHLKSKPGISFFNSYGQDYAVVTTIEQQHNPETGMMDYVFVSNLGAVENRRQNEDGTYNYLEKPSALSDIDDYWMTMFDDIYINELK